VVGRQTTARHLGRGVGSVVGKYLGDDPEVSGWAIEWASCLHLPLLRLTVYCLLSSYLPNESLSLLCNTCI